MQQSPDTVRNYLDKKTAFIQKIDNLHTELIYRLEDAVIEELFRSEEIFDLSNYNTKKENNEINVSEYGSLNKNTFAVFCLAPSQYSTNSSYSTLSDKIKRDLTARYIFPEYKDRSVFSLLWELNKFTEDSNDKKLTAEAIEAFNELRKFTLKEEKFIADEHIIKIIKMRDNLKK